MDDKIRAGHECERDIREVSSLCVGASMLLRAGEEKRSAMMMVENLRLLVDNGVTHRMTVGEGMK